MIKNAVASLLMVRAHLHYLPRTAPAPTYRRLLLPVPRLRPAASALVPAAAMSTAAAAQAVADQKRAVRTEVRKALKALSPDQRASEDLAIQSTILNSSWFKASKRLCAYISCHQLREVDTSKILAEVLSSNPEEQAKDLYVPRVEDKNRNMRMLKITNMDDLVKNSMNILEPSPLDANGNDREDVLSASCPVDLFLLPGQAFDRTGRRLGRGGGYYDTFLMKYQELAKEKGWSQPLLVALSYSVQIMEDGSIPINSTDVPIDALVSSSGIIPISSAALERMS